MNALSFGLQAQPFGNAKPVLLINDRKGQVFEKNIVLEQRMCADGDLRTAVGKLLEALKARRTLMTPRQEDRLQTHSLKGSGKSFEMLSGQNFCGRHEG